MPYRNSARTRRPAMYNTPAIRNGGFGALQVEAITNRPLSIARRHLAASVLRIRNIEPDELSSSEWVRFLVMEEQERDRWISNFLQRRRRRSDESTVSTDGGQDKAEEARQEARESRNEESASMSSLPSPPAASPSASATGRTPLVSIWAREFDEPTGGTSTPTPYSARRPMHTRRAVTDGIIEAPPTYDSVVRPRTPPPAYDQLMDDDGSRSPLSPSSP